METKISKYRENSSTIYVIDETFSTFRNRQAGSMRKRKMCVRAMEDNEDERVVNAIINYFTTRVNSLIDLRRKFSRSFPDSLFFHYFGNKAVWPVRGLKSRMKFGTEGMYRPKVMPIL